jgi:AraC-like DNA-binding protein
MNLAIQKQDDFRSQDSDKPQLSENQHLMADVSIGKFIQDLYLKSGFQAKSWYEDYGVSSKQLKTAGERFPHELTSIIWKQVKRESRDPHIGLHLAETTNFPPNHFLYYLTSSCSTLGAALTQFEKYARLLSDACTISLVVEGRQAKLVIDLLHLSIPATDQQMDFWLLVFAKHMATMTGSQFAPTYVRFKHERPVSSAEHWRIFNCRASFGQTENAIVFPSDLLDLSVASGNDRVYKVLAAQAKRRLSRLRDASIIDRVTQEFTNMLGEGRCLDKDINRIASNITMHPRTLQRKLAAEDTSYSQILDEYKKEVALGKLTNTSDSIADVASDLGYADCSAFYRAFKRWTSITPSQYRQRSRFDCVSTDGAVFIKDSL